MTDESDITRWLERVEQGDSEAEQVLWDHYFMKLVWIARQNLLGAVRRTVDEEDVALSAMNSFYRGGREGRFDQLKDRDELWKLLLTITIRKAGLARRTFGRQKRGGGQVRGRISVCGASVRRGSPRGTRVRRLPRSHAGHRGHVRRQSPPPAGRPR